MPEPDVTTEVSAGSVVLDAQQVRIRPDSTPIDLALRSGEIVGLAGLDGHGQEEFLKVLCGLRKPRSGTVTGTTSRGRQRNVTAYRHSAAVGVGYLPRDRKTEGIFASMSVLDNYAMTTMGRRSTVFGFLRVGRLLRRYRDQQKKLGIVTRSPQAPITSLSGGNQQKVLLARQLAAEPRILLLDDPTRGVDLGTRLTFYDLFRSLASDASLALVLLSTELEELVSTCDRVLVFRNGAVSAELSASDLTVPRVIGAMFGEVRAE